MNLLVTGAAGFIGSNFVRYYLREHPERTISGLDSLTYAGNLENLDALTPEERGRFSFIKGDITDRKAVNKIFSEFSIDAVVNFAAESHVDRSIMEPGTFLRTNVLGTATLLDAARESWCREGSWTPGRRFLQVSTDEVYGSLGPDGRFCEDTPLDPRSPYSASKAAADLLVRAYHATYGMPVLITRCSNNYGPCQFPEKLIPLIIRNALAHMPLPVYGDGRQVRDWLHVEDHCRAVDLVLEGGSPGEVYNIGGQNEWENIRLVGLLCDILREETGDEKINDSLVRHVADRPGHDRRYAIDPSKIRRDLGWAPAVPFEEGLRATVRWYLENSEWLRHVTSGEYLRYYERVYLRP